MTRIALIHATPAAVGPIEAAFAETWPEPDLVNLLDDSLSRDRALAADLTESMYRRFDALGGYAVSIGVDAILFTCSAFGPAIERVARAAAIPVLKPNEAMFAEAIARGGQIGMLATFGLGAVAVLGAPFEAVAAAITPVPSREASSTTTTRAAGRCSPMPAMTSTMAWASSRAGMTTDSSRSGAAFWIGRSVVRGISVVMVSRTSRASWGAAPHDRRSPRKHEN